MIFFKFLRKRGKKGKEGVARRVVPRDSHRDFPRCHVEGAIPISGFSHFHLGSKSEVLTFMLHYEQIKNVRTVS